MSKAQDKKLEFISKTQKAIRPASNLVFTTSDGVEYQLKGPKIVRLTSKALARRSRRKESKRLRQSRQS